MSSYKNIYTTIFKNNVPIYSNICHIITTDNLLFEDSMISFPLYDILLVFYINMPLFFLLYFHNIVYKKKLKAGKRK